MPRTARKKSETGIYHIILRGINRQAIFEDQQDKNRIIETLQIFKEKCNYNLYAYCIMENHLHLLLKENDEPLAEIMRRIGSSYVFWYNVKYDRIGPLFQDRFKSEPVTDDTYFLTVLRYIHQNPLKAGIVKEVKDYRWSSYHEYLRDSKLVDSDFVLELFNHNSSVAVHEFIRFNNEISNDKCLDITEKNNMISDEELRRLIDDKYKLKAIKIQNEPKEKMKEILRDLKKIDSINTRQLSRVTGISVNIIWRL